MSTRSIEITNEEAHRKLELRRRYGCAALMGLMADSKNAGTPEQLAKTAWRLADAMQATELETLPEEQA